MTRESERVSRIDQDPQQVAFMTQAQPAGDRDQRTLAVDT